MDNYDIRCTGVRSGEYIIGRNKAKQCKGTVMQLRMRDDDGKQLPLAYPPCHRSINDLDPLCLRDVLNNFDYFAKLTAQQRLDYLISVAVDEDNTYINEVDYLEVRFSDIKGDFMLKNLTQQQITDLIAGNPDDADGYWPLDYVYNLFPRKPGSKARFHTLVFRPDNWCLFQAEVGISNYSGSVLDLYSGTITDEQLNDNNTIKLLQFGGYEMAVVVAEHSGNKSQLITDTNIAAYFDWCATTNPSVLKSLLQKIIRFKPKYVVMVDDVVYEAEAVLETVFLLLMSSPGSFNPDLQKWTSGLESALKRLAVTIAEDSYVADPNMLTSLLAGALLARMYKDWWPPIELIDIWCQIAKDALQSSSYYVYSTRETELTEDINALLLTELGSFQTDIAMLHSMALNSYECVDGAVVNDYTSSAHDYMYVEHCLDQHCLTELAHYVPYQDIKSYEELFSDIWQCNSKCSPRKKFLLDKSSAFVTHVMEAQRLLWLSKMHTLPELVISDVNSVADNTVDPNNVVSNTYTMELSDCWLSCIVGTREYKHRGATYFVMLNVNDPKDVVVIRKPSRDSKATDNDETKEKVETEVEELLTAKFLKDITYPSYVTVKTANIPDYLKLKVTAVTLKDDEYVLMCNKTVLGTWTEVRQLQSTVPTFSCDELMITEDNTSLDHWLKVGRVNNHKAVVANAMQLLTAELVALQTASAGISRLLYYISGCSSTIQLLKIGRDGKGSDYSVQPEDNLIFDFLCLIALIAPAALIRDDNKFTIKDFVVWSNIKQHILSFIDDSHTAVTDKQSTLKWSQLTTTESRKLWLHQVDALNKLKAGKKHQIIWIPAGLGKTAIITNYLLWLVGGGGGGGGHDNGSDSYHDQQQIVDQRLTPPKYVIYTLPPSAVKSVTGEFAMLKIPYHMVDMTAKGVKTNTNNIKPYCVNFVLHDQLRLLQTLLDNKLLSQTLLIIDEFHKTLNKTQRTSTALTMASLSWRFIAMTGTLIKDTHLEYIIEWLKLTNDFEVNKDNFWLALTSLICHKVQLPITVNRHDIDYVMDDELLTAYKKAVPVSLGGNAKTINWRSAVDISYSATTQALVDYACSYLESGLRCFMVARNIVHQQQLCDELTAVGYSCLTIGKNNTVSLTAATPVEELADVIITTVHYCEGYNLTAYSVMLTGVYFSNAATREQLERRIVRIGQPEPEVDIVTVHTGILSYIHARYQTVRSLSAALKSLAQDVHLDATGIADSFE